MNVFEDLVVELKEENLLEETVAIPPKSNGNGSAQAPVASVNGNGNGNGHKNSSPSADLTSKVSEGFRPVIRSQAAWTKPADQMSALQFVEFVISGSERVNGSDNLPFDELQVQKAFHHYTQAGSDSGSNEYLEAESIVIDSLRSWEEDLVKRDAAVPADAIRRTAENANPPLSPQALFALARFYRSIPVSESTYLKFDFVVTRLFSKFVDGERRDMLCSRSEIVKHLDQRYSDWGMNAFKSLAADDPDIALVCLSFDDLASEALSANRLTELIKAQLFERVCEFKRSTGAMLFVPQVTAAVIESNLKISRKLLDLVTAEAERGNLARLSGVNNELISNAVARTFEIENAGEAGASADDMPIGMMTTPVTKRSVRPAIPVKPKKEKTSSQGRSNLFGVNKWLLLATIISVIFSVGLYVWSEYYTNEPASTTSVKAVDLQTPELTKYIKTAKINNDMLYAVVTPQYTELGPDKRRDIVQQARQLGETKGYRRVTFYDSQGKTIAYCSSDRTDIH